MTTIEDVGLTEWPFDLVPPTAASPKWYGRAEFRSELDRVVASWAFRRTSGIYLLWADFGAGKTHALRYIESVCNSNAPPALCVYTELPNGVSDFHGVFEQIVRHIPEHAFRVAVNGLRAKHGSNWLDDPGLRGDRDTPRVLWQLSELPNDEVGELARRWLAGVRVAPKELTRLGGVGALRTSDDALRVLTTIKYMITEYGHYSRLVLLLDEFQRVGQASKARLHDVNAGLHMLYNACPDRLSIFLSYSIGIADAIKHLVSDELMSRVEEQLSLPMMTLAQATEFALDILEQAGTRDSVRVLTPTNVAAVMARLDEDSDHRLTPRRVMQVLGSIYEGVILAPTRPDLPLKSAETMLLYKQPTADAVG